ncbi:hypothetical protein Taro_014472 [Colocasia esculenta]|uniref:Uncharacterized protein n=1 Tax=Colocasia esculenta TaxID=4460 RepID=A0A843UQ91_COLES|nr:hypothetical protein [Colocasia esculenta]
MTQTTTGAQRLQIEHDGSNHTSKCVDTQADCVDTTGFNCSDCFLGQSSIVDTQFFVTEYLIQVR